MRRRAHSRTHRRMSCMQRPREGLSRTLYAHTTAPASHALICNSRHCTSNCSTLSSDGGPAPSPLVPAGGGERRPLRTKTNAARCRRQGTVTSRESACTKCEPTAVRRPTKAELSLLSLLYLLSLPSYVPVPVHAGLVALEGLLRLSFSFYPYYPFSPIYSDGP